MSQRARTSGCRLEADATTTNLKKESKQIHGQRDLLLTGKTEETEGREESDGGKEKRSERGQDRAGLLEVKGLYGGCRRGEKKGESSWRG